ncbi:MAG: hypothetical protein ISS56_20785 [Anaerolineae bacterium]|nr:hypothetical protein [Anaerolineae bacterium]
MGGAQAWRARSAVLPVQRGEAKIRHRPPVPTVLIGFLGLLALLPFGSAWAQSPNSAALVIQHADGTVSTQCVEFAEAKITGMDVLLRSGLEVLYTGGSGMGALVCKIDGEGCDDPGACLCECRGSRCVYWSYWHLIDGIWQYSPIGASQFTVRPGTVEGWVWGPGSVTEASPPPVVPFDQICSLATPTSRPTGTPSATSSPSPAATCPVGAWPTAVATSTGSPQPSSTRPTEPGVRAALTPVPSPSPSIPPSTQNLASAAPTPVLTNAATRTFTSTANATPMAFSTTPAQRVASSPSPPSPVWRSYLLFGGILALLGAIALIVRRQGKPELRP